MTVTIEIPQDTIEEQQEKLQNALNEIARIRRHLEQYMSGIPVYPRIEDETEVIRWIYPHLRFYECAPGHWSAQDHGYFRDFKYLPHRAGDLGRRGATPCPTARERTPEIVSYDELCIFVKALPKFLKQLWHEYDNIPQIEVNIK